MIHHGDCLDVMAGMDPESVDAIVTDPPYMMSFMGKEWDAPVMSGHAQPDPNSTGFYGDKATGKAHDRGHDNWRPREMQVWHERWASLAYRVAKPSAYLLAFGGTRTVHRMTCALEDAGWIIRDMLVWGYASGFPKSKASLKPAWEPIVMARKPGPLRMLAIDECRIPAEPWAAHDATGLASVKFFTDGDAQVIHKEPHDLGRWPANIVLTDPIFDDGIEGVVGGGEVAAATSFSRRDTGWYNPGPQELQPGYGDTGTYSRFFLVPKAARSDREPVLGGLPLQAAGSMEDDNYVWPDGRDTRRQNHHPTVKPVDLMRHLVRLVTPTGGTVLDPFLGSGTTGLAAEMEGFAWIGIEREAEYVAIAEARLNGTQKGMAL